MTEGLHVPRPPSGTSLRWPPPGLERMQGDLGRVAGRAALAGGLLVLPMLFVVAREQSFATLGPLADAWWVTIVLTSVGLAFAIDMLMRAARMLRRTGRAMRNGYDLATVWFVVADIEHDMGFLLQGARHFVVMDERERHAIVQIRVFSLTMSALAGLWLSIGLGVGLLAAARGSVGPSTLWMAVLLPAVAFYVFGGVAKVVNDTRVRRARKSYHVQPWSQDLVKEEIEAWRTRRASFEDEGADAARPSPRLAAILGRAGIGAFVFSVLIAAPVLTLLPTSVVGPVLSTLATPHFDRVRQQAARAEGLRAYRVPTDPGVSPQEAGRLLHELANVGTAARDLPGEREPANRVTTPWLPEVDPNPTGIDPFVWGDSLLTSVARGTTGAQRAYLAEVAAHPSSSTFSRLAEAAALDAASGRWRSPFPPEVTISSMPVPQFAALRAGAQAHIGAAAYALAQGRIDDAEHLVAEVVSVGFLLADDGPTLLDNLIGFALVESGGRALEDLFEAAGRTVDLRELHRVRESAARAAARVPDGVGEGTEAWVRALPDLVLDESVVRGLRWEYFIGVTTVTPCLNLHRMVFGPDQEYRDFLDQAHDSLVRFPSEEGLYQLARTGWLGTIQSERETWIGRVLSLSMRRGESGCGDVIRRIESAREMF